LAIMRRSLAMSPTLPPAAIVDLIDTCERLMVEREQVAQILDELGPAWGDARRALNALHHVLHGGGRTP